MARGAGIDLAIAEKRHPGMKEALFEAFSLTLAGGTVTAILGPSGIGKSSLLRLIAGIDRDFSGSLAIDGEPAAVAPPPGFVFQDARLLPWLDAADNVRLADPSMDRIGAAAHLASLGLAGHDADYPRQLSGGMQRRVALARTLATGSGVLLLDEPLVSLDNALVEELHALLARLFDESGTTALLVSHAAADAARLADRVIVLAGRPARIGADITLPVPRRERRADMLERYRREIDAALAGSA